VLCFALFWFGFLETPLHKRGQQAACVSEGPNCQFGQGDGRAYSGIVPWSTAVRHFYPHFLDPSERIDLLSGTGWGSPIV
jgi:hypothetical protein